jgi:hypothetical protein
VVGGAVLDRSLLFPLEVREALHLPVLAVVPDLTARHRRAPAASMATTGLAAGELERSPRRGRRPATKGVGQVPVAVFVARREKTMERDAGA